MMTYCYRCGVDSPGHECKSCHRSFCYDNVIDKDAYINSIKSLGRKVVKKIKDECLAFYRETRSEQFMVQMNQFENEIALILENPDIDTEHFKHDHKPDHEMLMDAIDRSIDRYIFDIPTVGIDGSTLKSLRNYLDECEDSMTDDVFRYDEETYVDMRIDDFAETDDRDINEWIKLQERSDMACMIGDIPCLRSVKGFVLTKISAIIGLRAMKRIDMDHKHWLDHVLDANWLVADAAQRLHAVMVRDHIHEYKEDGIRPDREKIHPSLWRVYDKVFGMR